MKLQPVFGALVPKSQVRHNNTLTTRIANEITERMRNKTGAILNLIKNRIKSSNGNIDIRSLRSLYGSQIHRIYAEGNREMFLQSVAFVEKFARQTHELDAGDLQLVNDQTRKDEDGFWRVVEDMVSKFQVAKSFKAEDIKVLGLGRTPVIDYQSRIEGIAWAGTFGLLGKSTLHLLRDVSQSIPASGQPFVPLRAGSSLEARIVSLKPIEIPEKLLVIWVTEGDARVCIKYCQPLDGRTFDIDDPATPKPVDDTHPRCRCRLLPVAAGGNVFNG